MSLLLEEEVYPSRHPSCGCPQYVGLAKVTVICFFLEPRRLRHQAHQKNNKTKQIHGCQHSQWFGKGSTSTRLGHRCGWRTPKVSHSETSRKEGETVGRRKLAKQSNSSLQASGCRPWSMAIRLATQRLETLSNPGSCMVGCGWPSGLPRHLQRELGCSQQQDLAFQARLCIFLGASVSGMRTRS